ncbi:DUF6900 domain-containing protein, partial [Streptococcus anginosus]|uniref:DUF6900 domain-containing protein n=1 Tax=Streptococcus anginosus TaxID=1328 RepID=UPI003AFFBC83
MINEEISKEAGQAAQTIITYTIKAAKESINLDKEIRKKMNETLETRMSDNLDFYDVSVWGIKRALERAYEAGQQS